MSARSSSLLLGWLGLIAATGVARPAERLSLGRILVSEPFAREVTFVNDTEERLTVERVELTPPLEVRRAIPPLMPGATGRLLLEMGDDREPGIFEGSVKLFFSGASR